MTTITTTTLQSPYIDAAESIENAKKTLLKGASKLPLKDRELFKHHIDGIATKIFAELNHLRLSVASSKDWNFQVESSIKKMHSSANDLTTACQNYEVAKAQTNLNLGVLGNRIDSCTVDDDLDFTVKPKTAKELMAEDPLWAHKYTTIQGNIAMAHVVASAVNNVTGVVKSAVKGSVKGLINGTTNSIKATVRNVAIGAVKSVVKGTVKETAKGIARGAANIALEALNDMGEDVANVTRKACQLTSTTQRVCQQTQSIAVNIATSTIDVSKNVLLHTGITAAVENGKKAIQQIDAAKQASKANGSILSDIYLHDYLIPKEATRQYLEDVSTVTNGAVDAAIAVPVTKATVIVGRSLLDAVVTN